MMATLREVYRSGQAAAAQELRRQVVRLTSTTQATTKQITEYLDDIAADARELGILLPYPEDYHREVV
jgi:hypothetical protein